MRPTLEHTTAVFDYQWEYYENTILYTLLVTSRSTINTNEKTIDE